MSKDPTRTGHACVRLPFGAVDDRRSLEAHVEKGGTLPLESPHDFVRGASVAVQCLSAAGVVVAEGTGRVGGPAEPGVDGASGAWLEELTLSPDVPAPSPPEAETTGSAADLAETKSLPSSTSSSSNSTPSGEHGIHFGKYKILRRLGRGGMAEVFEARLTGIGGFAKAVVIKRIHADRTDDPLTRQMFLDEARLAANLSHPNIVQTFEIAEAEGVPYLALEYVQGETLAPLLRTQAERGAPDVAAGIAVMVDICKALHYAHNARDADDKALHIVHRDVSPHNIMVARDGTVKLLDFGIAKASGRSVVTQTGTVKGKLAYMAPEQFAGDDLDFRADVFAAGVCLYEVTVGRRPFPGKTDVELMRSLIEGTFPPPTEVVPDYPPGLEKIVLWAMAWHASDRCPSAGALAEALEDFLSENPHLIADKNDLAVWASALGAAPASLDGAGSTPGGATPSRQRAALSAARRAAIGTNPGLAAPPDTAASPPPRSRLAWLAAMAVVLLVAGGALWTQSGPSAAQRSEARTKALLDGAQEELGSKRVGRALALLRTAQAEPPASPELSVRLTMLVSRAEHDSSMANARNQLDAGEIDKALESAKAALERDPDSAEARAMLAEAEGRRSKAAGAAAPPALGEPGRLSVTTEPPASVLVDDVAVGSSPLDGHALAPGRHVVEMRLVGYQPQRREIDLVSGQLVALSAALRPNPAVRPGQAAARPDPKREEERRRLEEEREAKAAAELARAEAISPTARPPPLPRCRRRPSSRTPPRSRCPSPLPRTPTPSSGGCRSRRTPSSRRSPTSRAAPRARSC